MDATTLLVGVLFNELCLWLFVQAGALLDILKPRDPGCAFVRLGGPHDGGYLIPDDLDGIVACFSPGVDQTSAFERDCLDRGMALYLSDASVTGVGPEL